MNPATQKLVALLEHTVHTIAFRVDCPTPEKTQLLDALREFKIEVGAAVIETQDDDRRDLPQTSEPVLGTDRPEPTPGG